MTHRYRPEKGRFSSGSDEPSERRRNAIEHISEGVGGRHPAGAVMRSDTAVGLPQCVRMHPATGAGPRMRPRALALGKAAALVVSLALVPGVLLAQEGPSEPAPAPGPAPEGPANVPLDTLPGLSAPQRAMGAAVDTLCPQLLARAPAGLSAGERDLLEQCTAIITASGTDPGDAAAGVVALTPEQAVAPRRVSAQLVGTQVDNLAARLQTLRAGTAGRGGLTMNGLTLPGQIISGAAAGADEYQFERLAFFVNGNLGWGNKDRSANEDGFDYDIWGLTAGADYVLLDGLVAGLALGYSSSSVDIDANGGNLDADSWSLSA